MTKRIASVSQKGGVGKSTWALFMMDFLTNQGKSVLMIDLDPQGTLTLRLGVSRALTSLAPIFQGEEGIEIEDTIVSVSQKVSLIPSNSNLGSCTTTPERTLLKIKRQMSRVWGDFDYVIIDSPPAVNALSAFAILLANVIVIPLNLSVVSRDTLKDTNTMIEDLMEMHNDLEDTIYFANRAKKKDISLKKQIQDQYVIDLGESLMNVAMPEAEVAVEERLAERHNHFEQKKVNEGILLFFQELTKRIEA